MHKREEVTRLTEVELDDELQRPTGNWKEDVQSEALRRILKQQAQEKSGLHLKVHI